MQEKLKRRSNRDRTETTRQALIEAARELFVEKGYGKTGTPEIVTRAAVTRGALYHHFADKKDLFRAVVEREAGKVADQIEARTATPLSGLAALLAGADAYFDAMEVPGRTRLLLRDGPSVLGHGEMQRIDMATGAEQLRQGLVLALGATNEDDPALLAALAELLSATFDRAALAIAEGRPAFPYRAALHRIFASLLADAAE